MVRVEQRAMTMRQLARRAGLSVAQISRIESGQVGQPSMDTIYAIARALDRNPRLLLVLSGHIRDEAARQVLGSVFFEGSELVEDWRFLERDQEIAEARELLKEDEPDEEELRKLAAKAFTAREAVENSWSESYLVPLVERVPVDLREVVDQWEALPPGRRKKVVEYVRDQLALARAEQPNANGSAEG